MTGARIVIVGGGYAGLAALRTLARERRGRLEVVLLDPAPHHTVKTRFHERAVLRSREPGIRFSLARLAAAWGGRFVQDEALAVDPQRRAVEGRLDRHPYDVLLAGPGGHTAYFGVPGAAERTVGLQTYEAADLASRRFEALGLRSPRGPRRRVVVCGAGIEGLEVAAMVRQAAPVGRCDVVVVERGPVPLERSQCSDALRRYLVRRFGQKRIELRLGTAVARVAPGGVELDPGGLLEADLVYWCVGVQPEPLEGLGTDPFRPTLQHPRHDEVFGLGDFVRIDAPDPANLASAQRAVSHGAAAARNALALLAGRDPQPVEYRPEGEVVALGDWDGIGVIRGVPVRGLAAAAAKKLIEARYLAELLGSPGRARKFLGMG